MDAIAFNDAMNDERLNLEFVRAVGIRSVLVAPLIMKRGVVGAINFYGMSRQIIFEEEQIDFARKLSASVSLAIDNAQLYEVLSGRERLLKALLNSIPDMAWLKDKESRFILVNEPFGSAAGKNPEELIGKTDFDAWPRELAERYRTDDLEVVRSQTTKRVEEPLAPIEGDIRWIETIKTPIYDDEGVVIGTAGIARDTTERKRMEEQIRHMAQHDPLTGLANRRFFTDILKVEIAQARRHKSKLAVLFVDLDRFKEINDTLGHSVGDELLKEVAARFCKAVRTSDIVARIGGDEFNILLSGLGSPEDVTEAARKTVESLRAPIFVKDQELYISTSVGISIYPDDSDDMETLLRYADIALYHAKETGRNIYQFYNNVINLKNKLVV